MRAGLGPEAYREITDFSSVPGLKDLFSVGVDDDAAFCAEAVSKAFDDAELAAFQASDEERKLINHSDFSFPIFNVRYDRAVVARMHSCVLFYWTADGVKLSTLQAVYFAIIIEKANGVWRYVRTEILGIT